MEQVTLVWENLSDLSPLHVSISTILSTQSNNNSHQCEGMRGDDYFVNGDMRHITNVWQ